LRREPVVTLVVVDGDYLQRTVMKVVRALGPRFGALSKVPRKNTWPPNAALKHRTTGSRAPAIYIAPRVFPKQILG